MNNFDLDINLFNNLKYSLLMHGEVNVDNVFDSHMYADTNRVITLGVGFNVEKLDNIQYICALKLGVLKPVSEIEKDDGDFSFKKCLNNANKFAAVNNIASAVSACIQSVKNKGNYGIQKEDRQILNIDTQLISIEELENSIADTLSSKSSNNKQSAAQKEKTTTNTAAYGPLSHRRALLLELSVNKAIEDTINTLNETQYKNDKLNIFNFTLTKEEAVEIFSVLSMSFYKDLIRSLKTGHSKNIFSSSFALHSKLILSFLSNYYQMPDKFNTYNDPQAYFSNAISKNNSRFLTWFGIRYYIDLVSATVNNQYTLYRKRRIHEAALFELIERDADGNIDIFNSALDIFNYLNIEMLVVHTGNRPLKDYGTGYSYLKFIEQHPHCKSVDITAQDSGVIKLSTSEEYICFLDTTTKINDILRLLQDSSSVKADDYIQEVLDFANCHKIFQPFLVYINEKFSKGIVDVDYKLDEIFVINSSNNSKFRNSLVSKISEKSNAERIEILIISLMEYNQHQRFYDILSSYDNLCITFYVLQGKNHTLTVENMTETNFKIILYTKTSEINAVNISGEYIYEREETSYFYKHKDNDKLEAEYILSENKLIIRYDKTTRVTLLNYIPSNNHCGIILSNKDTVNPEPKTVSQSGEMSIKVNFSASSIFDFNCIDKKKYYLYNVETGEIIDTLVELQGNGASASFKLNMDSGMLSNTKCIFSFFYEDICSLRLANFLSHDMCLINHFDREAKQVEVTAKINEKEVPRGVVTGIEFISPASDNLPEQSAFMSTEYKLKAITKDVEDSSQVKWCYAVLTDSEYRGKIKVSQVSESLSQTGEEISIKPEDILSESSKKKLENKDVSAKLYIFAYMKSPALYVGTRKTHIVCKVKSNVKIEEKLSEHFSLSELVNTTHQEYIEENRKYAMEEDNYLKLKKLCTDILEPIRTYINDGNSSGKKAVIITSGARFPKLNEKVGGSSTSQHMFCEAVDIQISGYISESKEHKEILIKLFKDMYNNKVSGLDKNIISQCIFEKHRSYWLHIGIKSDRKIFDTEFKISPNTSPRKYIKFKGEDKEFLVENF